MRTGTGIAVCITMFTSACVIAAGAVIAVKYLPNATPNSELDYALYTCEYGSAMFYVARGIDTEQADVLAKSDCMSYLHANGEDYMIDFYGVDR